VHFLLHRSSPPLLFCRRMLFVIASCWGNNVLILAHAFAVNYVRNFLAATLTSLALVHLFYARLYIYICYVLRSLLHFHIFERTSLESSEELLFHVYYNTTLRYGNMTKYGKQNKLTRQKDVNKCAKCWKGCRRPPSGQTLSVFLTSISNEILQNHQFLMILKTFTNPKHSQTQGHLEAPAPSFNQGRTQ